MNELGKRLNELAGQATAGVAVADPSRSTPVAVRPQRRRTVAFALIAAAVAATLLLWQSNDSGTTSVVAGQGGDSATEFFDGPCAVEPVLELLQTGIPTFDYEPAGSYAELAASVPAVVYGAITSAERSVLDGRAFVELSVTDVADARTGHSRDEIAIITYDAVWADRSQTDPLGGPVALGGVPFLAFIQPWSGVRGGWNPGVEGLYIACGADEPARAVVADAAGPDEPPNQSIEAIVQLMAAEFERQVEAAQENLAGAVEAEGEAQRQANRDNVEADPVLMEQLEDERIEAGRALWRASHIDSYRLRYAEWRPEGQEAVATLRIENGVVVDSEFAENLRTPDQLFTVEDLFDIALSVDTVRDLTLDPLTGHPTDFSVNPDDALAGDDFSVRFIQMASNQDIDSAALLLEAWLPESVTVSEGPDFLTMRSPDVTQIYPLHKTVDIQAFVYLTGDEICVTTVVAPSIPEATGGSSTCRFVTDFVDGTMRAGNPSGLNGEPPFLLIIPSLSYLDEKWSAEAEGGALEVTSRSVLFIPDEDALPGQWSVTILCDCGDRTFSGPR